MANLASTGVSLYPSGAEAEDYTAMKGVYYRRVKIVTNTACGGLTNQITAAVLGFKKLVNCGPFYNQTDGLVTAATVDPINNILLLGGGASNAIADVASGKTGYITVWGT